MNKCCDGTRKVVVVKLSVQKKSFMCEKKTGRIQGFRILFSFPFSVNSGITLFFKVESDEVCLRRFSISFNHLFTATLFPLLGPANKKESSWKMGYEIYFHVFFCFDFFF